MAGLCVIIVSFNTRGKTLRCIEALAADLAADVEIRVVDNASTDGSADAVTAAYPAIRLHRSDRNLGFAAANNLAIRESTADQFLLLNSDAYIRPGAIAGLQKYLANHPEAAAVGPRLLNLDGSLQPSCFKFPGPLRSVFDFLLLTAAMPNHRLFGDYRAWPHDGERTVDFVSGACMLICKTAIDQVGLLDESFFFYFEEADWCLRARRLGWTVGFTASAEVVHEGGGSGIAEPDRVFNQFQSGHARLIRKHYGRAAAGFVRVVLGVGAAVRILLLSLHRLLAGRNGNGTAEALRKWNRILAWSPGFNETLRN